MRRRCHDLIGNLVRFLLVRIVRLTDSEFSLDATLDCLIPNRALKLKNCMNRGVGRTYRV